MHPARPHHNPPNPPPPPPYLVLHSHWRVGVTDSAGYIARTLPAIFLRSMANKLAGDENSMTQALAEVIAGMWTQFEGCWWVLEDEELSKGAANA